jgi:hypothetical protein
MRGKSVFQLAFSELFRKSGMGVASRTILHTAAGDEIQSFHESLIGESMRKKQIRFRSYGGDDIIVPTEGVLNPMSPAKEIVEIVKEYLSEAYILVANADPTVATTIRKLQESPSTKIVFTSDNPDEIKTSFFYDVPSGPQVFNSIFKSLILPDIIAPVQRLTPVAIQSNLFESIEEQFKLKWDEAASKFVFTLTPDKLSKLISPLIMSNRGFIRAKYADMILPDTAPFKIIKLIESIGKNLAEKTSSLEVQAEEVRLGEALSVEEASELKAMADSMKKPMGAVDVSFVSDTNGYELKSFLTFGKARIDLIPSNPT